jgi:hypothetical protein
MFPLSLNHFPLNSSFVGTAALPSAIKLNDVSTSLLGIRVICSIPKHNFRHKYLFMFDSFGGFFVEVLSSCKKSSVN